MKIFTVRSFYLGALIVALTLSFTSASQGQAEKVKQKAKDLKKQVEGTAPKTNPPPAKPTPVKPTPTR